MNIPSIWYQEFIQLYHFAEGTSILQDRHRFLYPMGIYTLSGDWKNLSDMALVQLSMDYDNMVRCHSSYPIYPIHRSLHKEVPTATTTAADVNDSHQSYDMQWKRENNFLDDCWQGYEENEFQEKIKDFLIILDQNISELALQAAVNRNFYPMICAVSKVKYTMQKLAAKVQRYFILVSS
jgi:hypothetical protein